MSETQAADRAEVTRSRDRWSRVRRQLALASVFGGALFAIVFIATAALTASADSGTCDVFVLSNTVSKSCTTADGAQVAYLGANDTNADNTASSGTGTFEPFVRLAADGSEQGYNTNGTLQFDTKSGTWTHAILLSQIPVLYIGGNPYWEIFADVNETNNDRSKPVSLNDLEVWLTTNALLTGYVDPTGFPSGATKVYDFHGDILMNDVNSGSGRMDLRYRIPVSGVPAGCAYGETSCTTYFLLYTKWGTSTATPPPTGDAIAGATYQTDGGFEEWKTKVYPTLQIKKHTTGGNDTFTFAVTGPTTLNPSPSITTVGGAGQTVIYIVDPGTYTIAENTPPSGWAFDNATCTINGVTSAYTPGSNISILGGTNPTHAVCDFYNSRQAKLRIDKVTVPGGDTTSFTFTPTGWNSGATFSLTDADTAFASGDLAAGTYSVAESVPTGWALTARACVLTGTSTAKTFTTPTASSISVTLAGGEDVTCTFTDTKQAKLRVDKVTVPGGDTTSFTFTPTGWNSGATFGLTDADTAFASAYLAPGTYSVAESVPTGWELTGRACVLTGGSTPATFSTITNGVSVTLSAGQDVTCTFTDTKQAKIIVDKVTSPGGDTTEFTFTPHGFNADATFTLADGTTPFDSGYLTPGAGYSVAETVPTGWDLTSATCSDESPITNITLSAGEVVTCTFTDTKLAKIIVDKVTSPGGDTTEFTFTPHGFNGDATFQLADGTTPFASGWLLPGAGYSVAETVPDGWDLTSAVCDDASPITNITLSAGEVVTCTFTDTKLAKIIVDKVTSPGGDTTEFTFTPHGFNGDATFNLADGTTPFASGWLLPGAGYSVAETVPDGWDLTSAVCSDESPITNITLSAGETVTCTFTDTKRAKIIVDKVTSPGGDTTEFTFTPHGFNGDATFQLADGTTPFASGWLLPGAGYSVAETVPTGWDLTTATCDDGSPITNITLSAGEVVTCTFTDTKLAKIVVDKATSPGGDEQLFTFTPHGFNADATFQLADMTDPFVSGWLLPGAGYSVAETVPDGWDLTSATCDDGSPITNISLSAGETVTCTFTNTKRAKIVVDKVTNPGGDEQLFTFTPHGFNAEATFQLADMTDPFVSGWLVPGAGYTVAETVPDGWDLTSATCDDGSPITNISLSPGETVTCTFTNTKRAHIIVDKNTNPGGSETLFTFTPHGFNGDATFQLADMTTPFQSGALLPGAGYTVAETVPDGWDLTSATCDDGSPVTNISLSPGETVTCTFVNTERAHIIVDKVTNPGGDETLFTFTPHGFNGDATFQLADATTPFASGALLPGAGYSVAETVPAGWDLTSATCDDGSPITNISLSPGETVTCTFTNTKRAKIIVDKNTNPGGDPQLFTFTPHGFNSENTFTLADTSTPFDSGWLLPGAGYTVAESALIGWDLTDASCSDGSPITNISLSPGEVVTCTFSNTKRGTIIVTKVAKGGNGTFSFPTTSGTDTALPNPIQITTTGTPNGTGTVTTNDLKAGTYTLTETFLGGWTWTGVTCTATTGSSATPLSSTTSPSVTLTLAPGGEIHCTYENTAPMTTRTQGFWATHMTLLTAVWNGGEAGGHTFAGVADKSLCTTGLFSTDMTVEQVLGGFWANIAQDSDGIKRDKTDQAKMRLLQQLLAAILNNAAFGSSPTGTISIEAAKAVFCDPSATLTQINNAASAMANFNQSGDSGIFTPGVAANAKEARNAADIGYWDVLP